MEKLTDFLIDVFYNVWRKFKNNAVIILIGGILASVLIMPYFFKTFSLFSLKYILLRILIVALLFIFLKVYVLTIKEIKISFSAVKYLFQNLLKPLVFSLVFVAVFGTLIFIASVPFLFPDFTEKYYILVFSAATISAIAFLALLPNAIISLFFSYEGKPFKTAIISGAEILKYGRGKMYFLTVALLLCTLILNLTHVGMIIVFPLFMLSMGQAKESLVRIEEEKRRIKDAKQSKYYRPKVDYTKDYASAKYEQNAKTGSEFKTSSVIAQNEEVKGAKSGLGSIFQVNHETMPVTDDETRKAEAKKVMDSKIVSKAEYGTMPAEARQEEDINLSDFIDFGLYDKEVQSEKKIDEDVEVAIERDIKIEFEYGEAGEFKTKKEATTGKQYIEEFGTIKRKPPPKGKDNQDPKKVDNAKKYIENFGLIKRKK